MQRLTAGPDIKQRIDRVRIFMSKLSSRESTSKGWLRPDHHEAACVVTSDSPLFISHAETSNELLLRLTDLAAQAVPERGASVPAISVQARVPTTLPIGLPLHDLWCSNAECLVLRVVGDDLNLRFHSRNAEAADLDAGPNGAVVGHPLAEVGDHEVHGGVVEDEVVRAHTEDLRPALATRRLERKLNVLERLLDLLLNVVRDRIRGLRVPATCGVSTTLRRWRGTMRCREEGQCSRLTLRDASVPWLNGRESEDGREGGRTKESHSPCPEHSMLSPTRTAWE